jgi:capsular polysaccharide biosynthesis protein
LPKKLYVKRIGKRKLLGADKLMTEYGFTVMIPEEYSVLEQMTLFYNADIVFCVHGANSTNCLYMRKGTVFIEAFSSYWMNRCNLYATVTEGVNYLPVSTLETVRDNHDGVIRDFTFPEILLHSVIKNALMIYKAQYRELK